MLVELTSVGTFIDTKTGLTYASVGDGKYNPVTEMHITDIDSKYWWNELSAEDRKIAMDTMHSVDLAAPAAKREFLAGVDWKLLTQQKQTLLDITQRNLVTGSHIQDLDGLVNFLDAFQDNAVASGVPEEEVYPNI